MRITVLNRIVGSFTLFLLLMLAPTHAVAASATLLKAKKEAEAKGYIFYATHDEIVAMAKKEGKLRIMIGLERQNFQPLTNAFKQKYPFITDIHVEEVTSDAYQRVLLEIKAGQAKGWDITHIPLALGKEYMPHIMKHDILGMAKHAVLKIDPRMVHPVERNVLGHTSVISVVAYNRKLISEDKVPDKWEDFLKPEFKGKKFVADIRPIQVPGLVPLWGLERTLDFARKLAAQQPVWGRGPARIATDIAAGEYSLMLDVNFSTVKRAMSKDPTGSLNYKVMEPVCTWIVFHASGILNTADRPHAALLWLEFLASPEGQEIIDKYEPFKASVFTPGSAVAQEVRGRELSLVDWNHFTKVQEYVEKIVAAFGFPRAEQLKGGRK
ncbi:MAG: ABC transporter substrate-binding protein [Deltaproteobacteria bacterium]|nr:ABC transporter substrate-binding protein [Deltaproteobacteria bacterium]